MAGQYIGYMISPIDLSSQCLLLLRAIVTCPEADDSFRHALTASYPGAHSPNVRGRPKQPFVGIS